MGPGSKRLGVAVAVAVGIAAAGAASGATGDPRYRGCVTGETESGPGGSGACAQIASATSGAEHSGLYNPESLALSRDGKSLYLSAAGDDGIAHFRRNRSGRLTYRDCITGKDEAGPSGTGACRAIPSAAADGAESGLDDLRQAVVSGDGRHVYAVSADDASIATFKRNRRSGKLRYVGCLSGETQSGPGGSGACRLMPDAAPLGADSGLDEPKALTISRDGKSVYAAAVRDAALVRFKRNRRSGKLRFRNCLSGDTDAGPAGSGACRALRGATAGGEYSGFNDLRQLTVSRNGKSLYTVATDDDAVARFKRNRRTGALRFKDCVTGDTLVGAPCRAVPDASADAANSGFDQLRSISVSRDGRSLYASSRADDALVRFKRNRRSGRLAYRGCLTGESETGPVGSGACVTVPAPHASGIFTGLDGLETVEVSRDGRSVYAISPDDAALTRFRRNRRTGAIRFRNCLTGETSASTASGGACAPISSDTPDGEDSGLAFPQFLVLSGDRKSAYVAVRVDHAIASFRLAR